MDSAASVSGAAWVVAAAGLAWVLVVLVVVLLRAWRGTPYHHHHRQLQWQLEESNAQVRLQKAMLEREKTEVRQQKLQVEIAHRHIALLSDIGRQITASLDHAAIMGIAGC